MTNSTPPEGPRKDRGGPVAKANWVLTLVFVGLALVALALYEALRTAH